LNYKPKLLNNDIQIGRGQTKQYT